MSNKFQQKLKKKQDKKKKKIEDLNTRKGYKALAELQGRGMLKYTETEDDSLSVQVNAVAALDFFNGLPEIPFPIENYDKLKSINRSNKVFREQLVVMLGVSSMEYERVGYNLNKMRGTLTLSEEDEIDLERLCAMINMSYDLDNPRVQGNYYMFSVDKKHISKWEEIAENQKMEEFPKYYL